MNNKEFDNLRREENNRQTMQTLNALELWLRFGQAYLEIRRKLIQE